MAAQVGKTSLILSLVSEEFPEEVSSKQYELIFRLSIKLFFVYDLCLVFTFFK